MFVLLGLLASSLVYIVYTVVMAIVCAVIAAVKSRHILGWFVLGLILGVFALVIIAILPVRKRVRRQPGFGRMNLEAPVICPSCDYPNSRAWHHCRKCGDQLA